MKSDGDPQHPYIDFTTINQGHMALIIFAVWFIRIILIDSIAKCCCTPPEKKPRKHKEDQNKKKYGKKLLQGGLFAKASAKAEEKKEEEEKKETAKGMFAFMGFGGDDDDEFEGDEELPPFWCAINGRDQKHWFVQETYNTK